MQVLEFKDDFGNFAQVLFCNKEYRVEIKSDNRFFFSKTFKKFTDAEDYYWKKIKEELL